MPLGAKVRQTMEQKLVKADGQGAQGPRLAGDAKRLWARVRRLMAMNLAAGEVDAAPLELACYALQLPLQQPPRQTRGVPPGKLGRTNLRERAEQAADLLPGQASPAELDEGLLERTTQLLMELPARSPAMPEARLLADALNLDDFGVSGLIAQAVQITRQGGGVAQVADGCEKREQYGYWEARLKDGFHYEPVRQIARRRLENARRTAALLTQELEEDVAGDGSA